MPRWGYARIIGIWRASLQPDGASVSKLTEAAFPACRRVADDPLQSHGFSAREMQDVLGHANFATTMDVYAHVPPEELAAKMKRLDSWRSRGS